MPAYYVRIINAHYFFLTELRNALNFLDLLMYRLARPSSDGRQGTSRWCSAISLSCTLVPAPIFCVEPNKKRTCPLLTLPNSSAFLVSVFASCINDISSGGTPFSTSLFFAGQPGGPLPGDYRERASPFLPSAPGEVQ